MISARHRRLGWEFLWISFGQAIAVLGALFGVRILTGVLAPETYGQLALGMTVATFVNTVVLGPLSQGAIRFYAPAREVESLPGYFAAVKRLVLQASGALVLAAIVLCLALAWAGQYRWIGLSVAAICFALLSGYNSTLNGMQNAARQRAVVALHQGLLSWGRFLLAAGLVLWLGASSAVAMLGYCLATVLVLLSQRWFFRRTLQAGDVPSDKTDDSQRCPWRAEILGYAWPFATWGLLAWGRLVSDRWALQIFGTTEDVGFYAVLFQLGYYPITILAGLVTQLLGPICFQRAGNASDPRRVRQVYMASWRMTAVALVATAVAVALAMCLHKEVFRLLVSTEYHSVSKLLSGVVLAAGFFAAAQLCSFGPLSRMDSKCLAVPKNVSAAIGILLNLLGAMWLGLAGVIIANILFSLANLIWIASISVRSFRETK